MLNRITDQELQELHGLLLKLSTVGIEARLDYRYGLNDLDLLILMALAEGYQVKEMPKVIGVNISNRTIEAHIDKMRLKFGAKNAAHLIHLAHVKGVL